MSFFDEADDPRPASGVGTRQTRRSARSGGRPPRRRTGGRPPSHNQQVQVRRLIAIGVIVVIVVAMALLIHGCQVSATNSSLQTYAGEVSTWVGKSNDNGTTMFRYLSGGNAHADDAGLQGHMDGVVQASDAQLHGVEALRAPSQMSAAQQALVETMRLRSIGIRKIASQVQDVANPRTSHDAVAEIAVGMYMLAASDVDYKVLVAPAIVTALHQASLAVGGTSGAPVNGGQILSDLGWLEQRNIAIRLGAQVPATQANGPCPSVCGHTLNYVTIGGLQLSPTTINTLPSGTKPTFALSFTNGGTSNEYQVGCEVWIKGLSDRGHSTYPETLAGGTYNCNVTLPSAPPPGTYTVYAKIQRVPGEKNLQNNVLSFTVTVN